MRVAGTVPLVDTYSVVEFGSTAKETKKTSPYFGRKWRRGRPGHGASGRDTWEVDGPVAFLIDLHLDRKERLDKALGKIFEP